MKANRASRYVLALLATAIAIAIGCTEGGGAHAEYSDAQSGRFAAATEIAAAPSENPAPDQVLRIAGSRPVTLDPALVRDTGSSQYVVELFAGLVKLDSELNVVGDFAAQWQILGDGDVYRFDLRPSLKFADGKALHAEDVQLSLARALSPQTKSPTALSYLGNIEGARAFAEGSASSLTGVQILDSVTIEIHLTRPSAYFLYQLSHPVSFVVDVDETDETEWYRSPNSSGPFKLAAWEPGEEIVLEKNDNYHSPPRLSSVRIGLIGSSEALLRYETGQLDIVRIHRGDVERFRDSNDPLKDHYQYAPKSSLFYIGFNAEVPPFDDVHVRRAFAKAIDVEKITRVSLRGLQKQANGILPAGFPGHDPSRMAIGYDPADARAELAKSTYKSVDALPEIRMLVSGGGLLLPAHVKASLYLIRENLGVEIAVQTLEWSSFLNQIYGDMSEFHMYSLGWGADYPDPHNFLDLMFHSRSPENSSHYSNPEVDGFLEDARVELNRDQRLSLYSRVESIVVEEAPIVPFWFSVDHLLVRPSVRGLQIPPSTQEWMSSVWIAE